MKRSHALSLAVLFLVALPSLAQEPVARVAEAHGQTIRRFETWREHHGSGWQIDVDRYTGRATFVGGGTLAPSFTPVEDLDYAALAHLAILETSPLTGLEIATLIEERVKFLPLGLIGTTDKIAVRFHQEVGGVPVFGGRVNVLLDLYGGVLSVQSTALTGVAGLNTDPGVTAKRAREEATRAFETETGLPAISIGEARLGIGWELAGDERVARLVWEVDARWSERDFVPEGRSFWIDAHRGVAIRSRSTVHEFDVGGTVTTNATPGTLPDVAANPPVSMPVKDMRVKILGETTYTDSSGGFNFPGVTGPEQVTAEFVGHWAHVDNMAGPEEVYVQQLTGTGNSVVLNPTPAEAITAQANAFVHIGVLRDWVRAIDPSDDTADFQAYAKVNHNSTCNAYYDGFSVNFFASGGSCPNTGYTTVVVHEMGHWLNVLYHTGNGNDGMGEGNADVFGMYVYDTPIVGEDFLGPGTNVRDGQNLTMFCGDCCPNCHGGEVHKEGEPWMGAAWKIRDRLNIAYGNSTGDAIADGLFSGWMNAYDQTQIKSVIEIQWLTLDDDNGDLDDGTPHYDEIDLGFRDQGFPGYDKPAILYSDVTILTDTTDEVGPYRVLATVVPQNTPYINSVNLWYQVDDTGWVSQVMIPLGADVYDGYIPGQTSVAEVEYYFSSQDSNLEVVDFPKGGINEPIPFIVGVVEVLFFDDLESPDDNGWTHGTFGDTSNPHDDFQHGTSAGRAGDPSSAYSGSRVWGNDLGLDPWNGAYQNNQHNWLRMPAIDCTVATNTQLRFRRWLRVDAGANDQARIRVNGVEAWASELLSPTFDWSWSPVTLDLSALADGVPSVEIEFSLQSDAMTAYGGWSIDDVELRYLSPSAGQVGTAYCFGDGSGTACPCANPGSSTSGCTNSTGNGGTLVGEGSASVATDDLRMQATGLVPGQTALLFSGHNAVNSGNGNPFGDGLRCAGGSTLRLGPKVPNGAGETQWGPGLQVKGLWTAGDTRRLQAWYRDPAGSPCGSGFNLSNGVEIVFVP